MARVELSELRRWAGAEPGTMLSVSFEDPGGPSHRVLDEPWVRRWLTLPSRLGPVELRFDDRGELATLRHGQGEPAVTVAIAAVQRELVRRGHADAASGPGFFLELGFDGPEAPGEVPDPEWLAEPLLVDCHLGVVTIVLTARDGLRSLDISRLDQRLSGHPRLTIQPVIRAFHSPDVDDLEGHVPAGEDFQVLVQMLVGPAGGDGEESFDVLVVSVASLAARAQAGPVAGEHLLVVDRWDWRAIEAAMRARVVASAAEDWDGVGLRLGRFGQWEFQDYDERPGA